MKRVNPRNSFRAADGALLDLLEVSTGVQNAILQLLPTCQRDAGGNFLCAFAGVVGEIHGCTEAARFADQPANARRFWMVRPNQFRVMVV